jgi:hypothetical protein
MNNIKTNPSKPAGRLDCVRFRRRRKISKGIVYVWDFIYTVYMKKGGIVMYYRRFAGGGGDMSCPVSQP